MIVAVDFANLFCRVFNAWLRGRDPAEEGDGWPVAYVAVRTLGSWLCSMSLPQGTVVVAALEGGGTEARRAVYPGYKAQRKKTTGEAAEWKERQLEGLCRIMSTLPVVPIGVPGFEADDVVAALAAACSRRGEETVVVTNDGDARQLQALLPLCKVWDPTKKACLALDPTDPADAFPHLFKALVGDGSDCVPSVCGPVTARKLLFSGASEMARWMEGPHRPKKDEVDPPSKRFDAFSRNLGIVSLLPPDRHPSLPWISDEDVLALVVEPTFDPEALEREAVSMGFSEWPGKARDKELARWSRVAALSTRNR